MRQSIIIFVLVATLMAVSAFPVEEAELDESYQPIVEHPEVNVAVHEENHRVKRDTCDLLSGLGWGHAPCAAHCKLRGNRGGYCNSQGVCVCRN